MMHASYAKLRTSYVWYAELYVALSRCLNSNQINGYKPTMEQQVKYVVHPAVFWKIWGSYWLIHYIKQFTTNCMRETLQPLAINTHELWDESSPTMSGFRNSVCLHISELCYLKLRWVFWFWNAHDILSIDSAVKTKSVI